MPRTSHSIISDIIKLKLHQSGVAVKWEGGVGYEKGDENFTRDLQKKKLRFPGKCSPHFLDNVSTMNPFQLLLRLNPYKKRNDLEILIDFYKIRSFKYILTSFKIILFIY